MDSIVDYLNYTEEQFDMDKLKKFVWFLHREKPDIKFCEQELKDFNKAISENDVGFIFLLVKSKVDEYYYNLEDLIYEKHGDIWQFIIDKVCEKWDENMGREDYLDSLEEFERMAIKFGDFDYLVTNGGLKGWHESGLTDDDYTDIVIEIANSDYEKKHEFFEILTTYNAAQKRIARLKEGGSKEKEIWDSLEIYNQKYKEISNSWRTYYIKHLASLMPPSYMELVKEDNISLKI